MKRNAHTILALLVIQSILFSACGAFESYGRTKVTWFVGLGAGLSPDQIAIEKQVVGEFNQSQDKIWLVLEVAPNANANTILAEKIASGNAPDVVGPVGWGGLSMFHGEWLDMAPYIKTSNYNTTIFNENLVKSYQTEEGQIGLPFAVYPAVVFYNKSIFDKTGFAYPPAQYGEKYQLPDGTQVEWSWDMLTRIAKLLTLDKNNKNSTEADFDRENIIQYGYYPQAQNVLHIGTFWGAGQLYKEQDGKYIAHIPAQWKAAWRWYFDGIWGPEPFLPAGSVAFNTNKSNGNPFGYGIAAMAVAQLWYSACCIPLPKGSWDMAALPSYQGQVHGRVDADTFGIMKSTRNPEAAFEVIKYLSGPASAKLLESYGGMPAQTNEQDAFFRSQEKKFPGVTNWDVVQAGLSYPDIPSAEGYMPNGATAFPRILELRHTFATESAINFDAEIEDFRTDLQSIFDKR